MKIQAGGYKRMNRQEISFEKSASSLVTARKVIAGGVNSNFRMWEKPHPLFFDAADGPFLWDVDGNQIIDYVMGPGPLMLGHRAPAVVEAVKKQLDKGILYAGQNKLETEVAQMLVDCIPCADQVRLGTTGTEAVQIALRMARAATGRGKVLKFEGHYHGWMDSVLFNVRGSGSLLGSGEIELIPDSDGIAPEVKEALIVCPWNDFEAISSILTARGKDIAAVIMEPVMTNGAGGVILPEPGYLEHVRKLCSREGVVFIFDEVITGFRVDLRSAQGLFNVVPDLAVFGKAIASGFPVGCVAGKDSLFDGIRSGAVEHSGTFNGNPITMAAAQATLSQLDDPTLWSELRARGLALMEGVRGAMEATLEPILVQGLPTIFSISFTDLPAIRNHQDGLRADKRSLRKFLTELVSRGIRVLSRGDVFLSTAHTKDVIDMTIARFSEAAESYATRKSVAQPRESDEE